MLSNAETIIIPLSYEPFPKPPEITKNARA
jgi:hypothetical protein